MEYLTLSGDSFKWSYLGKDATGISWVETRDGAEILQCSAKYHIMHQRSSALKFGLAKVKKLIQSKGKGMKQDLIRT